MKTFFCFCAMIMGVMTTTFATPIDSPKTASFLAPVKQNSMTIDPKLRASDYREAFDFLRKEKAANKVYVKLVDGMNISNIIDMQLMGNSTIFMLRYNSPQGIKVQAVELEHIQGIGYLE